MYFGIIYCATSPSSKKYYGMSTKTLENRKNKHYLNTFKGNFSLPFNNAIRKYGIDNFKWEILEKYQNENKSDLISLLYEREIFYIKKDDTTDKEKGYNVSEGGSGSDIFAMLSPERQQEVRDTITKGVKKKWKDEKYRAKVVKSRNTEKYKKKQSINAKKQWEDPDIREKSLTIFKEKIWNNDERNEKIRNSLRNQKKYKCPYCGRLYNKSNLTRWHGENCKLK